RQGRREAHQRADLEVAAGALGRGGSVGSAAMATTEDSARAGGDDAAAEGGPVQGGKLVARALKDRGVSKLFTLSGGHLFSIYDGCVAEGVDIIDTRPAQAAARAAH